MTDRRDINRRQFLVASSKVAAVPLIGLGAGAVCASTIAADPFAPMAVAWDFKEFERDGYCKLYWALKDLPRTRAEFIAERLRCNRENGCERDPAHWPRVAEGLGEAHRQIAEAAEVIRTMQVRLESVLPEVIPPGKII